MLAISATAGVNQALITTFSALARTLLVASWCSLASWCEAAC